MSSNSSTEIQKLYEDLCYLKKENLDDSQRYRDIYQQIKNFIDQISPDETIAVEETCLGDEDHPVINSDEMNQLKMQILAFKHMMLSQKIPKNIIAGLSEVTEEQWRLEAEGKLKKSTSIAQNRKNKIEAYAENQVAKHLANDSSYGNKDMITLMNKIEVFSDSYIYTRKKELELLRLSNLFSKKETERIDLEVQFLDSIPAYKDLKQNIFGDVFRLMERKKRIISEKTYYDRASFKRARPKRSHTKMEFFELQIKKEQAFRKKEKHLKFLEKLFDYNTSYKNYFKTRKKSFKKVAQNVRLRHDWIKRKSQKEQEITNKKRTEDLRLEKYEEYIVEIQKAKDQRIVQILRETDTFLKEIGSKIVKMKKGNDENANIEDENAEWLRKDEEGKEFDVKNSTLLSDNYKKYYYSLTHSNVEEVKEQPSLLDGGTLKSYQLIGLQWLVSLYNNKLNGILADEMGLGKTIQTISLFCYIMEFKQNYGPFLVVVPLTTLQNWIMEFDKWAPSIKKIVYSGNQNKRKAIASYMKTAKWNVCLTTYEFILRDKADLAKYPWRYIIIDEGHKMKNPKSKFAQTLGQVYQSDNRVLLTGTPLQNNLPELWSLLNFLLPSVFSSCEDFERWFKMPMSNFGNEKELELNEEEKLLIIRRFHQVLRPFLLRRVKKEVENELPNKVEYVLMVELSAWQKIVYEQINMKQAMALGPSGQGRANNKTLMNIMMQLRKICDHPYLFMDESFYLDENLIRSSGKFELLDRILPKLISTGHRILLFTQMTRLIDILECFLEMRNIKFLRLDGTTKAEERAFRTAQFNKANSQFPIFILSTRAGGLGLNLQSADTVILIDSDWNPQMDAQAQDRAHRIGQTREVRVYRLITNTVIEKDILSKASYKKYLDEMIVQTGLFNQKSTEKERRTKIEELIKNVNEEEDDKDEEIPNDHEVNKMLARSDEEFAIFTRMDKERYERDKKVFPNFNPDTSYRLLTEDLVPMWVKETRERKKVEVPLGRRRARKHNNVNALNFENMDDDEYFKMIENGEASSVNSKSKRLGNPDESIAEANSEFQDNLDEQEDEVFLESADEEEA